MTKVAYHECDRCHLGSGKGDNVSGRDGAKPWTLDTLTVVGDYCGSCTERIRHTAETTDRTLYDLLRQAMADGADPDTLLLICEEIGLTPWYELRVAISRSEAYQACMGRTTAQDEEQDVEDATTGAEPPP